MINPLDHDTQDLLTTAQGVIAETVTPVQANKIVARSRKARGKHKIHTEKQRDALPARSQPYWHTLSPGHAIGVRKYQLGFVWCAKNGSVHTFKDSELLDYDDALKLVVDYWAEAEKPKPAITVQEVITAYVADLRVRNGISAEVSTRKRLEKHCASLMSTPVVDLTKDQLRTWLNALPGQPSTVNRVRAMLIAALNLTDCDPAAWRKLKALPTGDTAKKLLLTSAEIARLLDVTTGAFHNLLKAASLTGARLGELKSLTVADLDSGMLTLRGKTGTRTIPLRSDALEFFTSLFTAVNKLNAPLLPANDGRAWKPGNHSAFMAKAVRAANIDSQATFYSIRHYWISSCIRDGLPILAVSQYAGTSVAMVEKHYGKFQPDNMLEMFNSVSL